MTLGRRFAAGGLSLFGSRDLEARRFNSFFAASLNGA